MSTNLRRPRVLVLVMMVATIGGCGRKGPPTYPVEGKIELAGADVSHLAGSSVEAALTSNPVVRASGTIGPDGVFRLDTSHAGVILPGAPEGVYQVRFILTDDDRDSRRRAAKALAPRFLQFQTSGLSIQVPSAGDVVLRAAPR